jgi:hypothetical protein
MIGIEMMGGRPFFAEAVLNPVMKALQANSLFTPEVWGLDARSSYPFQEEGVSSVADGKPSPYVLQLGRKKRIKHTTLLCLSRRPYLTVEIDPKMPAEDWHHVFEFGDILAGSYVPDIA